MKLFVTFEAESEVRFVVLVEPTESVASLDEYLEDRYGDYGQPAGIPIRQ